MTDRRTYPANDRVAHDSLRGQLDGVAFRAGSPKMVGAVLADLHVSPDQSRARRDRQRLMGEVVTVLEDHDGLSFVICDDGYVGYIDSDVLTDVTTPTHRVATMATHTYAEENFKSDVGTQLPFGARLTVLDERPKFYETNHGFVPKKHLRPLDRPFEDPATVAQLHFQVPYLWGGNSTRGIDCSGLIQAAMTVCDIACPGDSDMQREGLGEHISGPYQRGDLMFWKGHVGMMVDEEVMIHANAHHMAVAYEPIAAAIIRIQAQGDGPLLAHKRL